MATTKTSTKRIRKSRRGKVTVINALASIHKILDEIAPTGKLHCTMTTCDDNASFEFTNNGIKASFIIEKGGIR